MSDSVRPHGQGALSMGFSRQEYWSGLPYPSPGDLPDPGIKPESLRTLALTNGFFTTSATWEAPKIGVENAYMLSHVRLFAIPWTIACQAPLSMGFPRQE